MKFVSRSAFTALIVSLTASPAFAHHAMDGETPATLWEGLVSGLAHPVIGLDHLAFIIAAGVVAGVFGMGMLAPVVFVAGSLIGVGLHLALLNIPSVELIIALSVALIGILLVSARARIGAPGWMALFGVVGLFHGYAYGESIVGAEQTPLAAYFVGLAVVQSAIAVAAAYVASSRAWGMDSLQPRLVGAAVFGVGLSAVAGQIFA